MAIKTATDATFEAEVLHNDRPVVVDFWAAWCGPCKLVAPEMEKLAAKYEGSIDIVKVDVDANPGLSRAFNIMSIPTIAFFAPGKQPMGVVGFRPAEQLETQFQLASYPKVEAAAAATESVTPTTAAESTNGAASAAEADTPTAATSDTTTVRAGDAA
jgi:thioredoxin 1